MAAATLRLIIGGRADVPPEKKETKLMDFHAVYSLSEAQIMNIFAAIFV